MCETTGKFRELDYFEEYFYCRTAHEYYTNFRVMAEYNIPLTPSHVHSALSMMLSQYSALVTDIQPYSDCQLGKALTIVDSVKIDDVVEFINDDKMCLEGMLEMCHDFVFKYGKNKPMWRMKVFNERYALVVFDHGLFDGTSGKNFHVEFAKALVATSNSDSNGKIVDVNSVIFDQSLVKHQLQPPPSSVMHLDGPWYCTLYAILLSISPKFIIDLLKYWFDLNPFARLLNYQQANFGALQINKGETSTCRIIDIPAQKITALLNVSRTHGVKLTSLMLILAQLSMEQFIGASGKDTTTSIPVNARSFIDSHKGKTLSKDFSDNFGLYVSGLSLELPSIRRLCPDGKPNWEVIQTIHSYIHREAPRSLHGNGLLQYTTPAEYAKERYNEMLNPTLEVSNLGAIPSTERGEVIEKAWFDQQPETFSVNMITTANVGTVTLRCVNEEWIDAFKESLEMNIDAILKAS
jgi:hypothetical protein